MSTSNGFENVLAVLQQLNDDTSIPRNVKLKVTVVLKQLNENGEASLRASRAIQELEPLTEDGNVDGFTRSQLFNVISMLEVTRR